MDPDPEPLLLIIPLITGSAVIGMAVLIVLLLCSALISGAEVAFFSLKPSDLETASDDNKQVAIVQKLLDKPKKLLATILVANNAINIAIVLLFASLGKTLLGSVNTTLFGVDLRFLIEVVIITFLILLFGEILPKIYASRNNKEFASFMAYPLHILDTLFTPISTPMKQITTWIQNSLGDQKSNFNVDQLSQALELASEDDTTPQEQKILQGIVSFGNTDTKQAMRPRMDIFALNKEDDYKTILPLVIKNGFSRIPVFKESIDTIIGILYIKDLLPHMGKTSFNWNSLLREPYYVPENKKLDDLLTAFKEKRNHLAIVVDEYGGTSGLISLEDIIEEIVGDISDEFDDEDIIYSKIDERNFVFDGKTSLKDFYKIIKMEDTSRFEENKGEAETIAGFVLEISGGFPRKNEIINYEQYAFTVEAMDNKRIKQIKFTML